ncbi:MAG: DUF2254 domain-containing protein [Candidatus Binatia bacterium]
MLHRFVVIWERVTTSLWFVPTLLSGAATLLAVGTLQIDAKFSEKPWWLNRGDGEQASTFLASLLSSMITMTTLVVSITMVVLTLAANSLGPRLIRSFMGDRRTQIILGTYVATIVYVFILLRTIDSTSGKAAVPHVAISVGTALCFICVCLLLFFVHHLGRSIVADVVIERVGADLDEAICRLTRLPGGSGREQERADGESKFMQQTSAEIRVSRAGYLQAIDTAALLELAQNTDAQIDLPFQPGQHFVPNIRKVMVSPASAVTPDFEEKVTEALVMGTEPAASNDVEFSVRQLVEIALRALSPGINDPFTATAVIDRLAISLSLLVQREPCSPCCSDELGVVRVRRIEMVIPHVLATAFNQIRQSSTDKPEVMMRMLEATASIIGSAHSETSRREVAAQARMLMEGARRDVKQPDDLARLEKKYAEVEAMVRCSLSSLLASPSMSST